MRDVPNGHPAALQASWRPARYLGRTLMITSTLLFLIPLSFAAGLVDAAVGGGGLILVPGLFAVMPGTAPATLMGTNKFAAIMGTASATWRYARRVKLDWHILLPCACAAFIGSYGGASVIQHLDKTLVRPMVIVLLLVMLVYTWFKPAFGTQDAGRPLTRRSGPRGSARMDATAASGRASGYNYPSPTTG